MLAKTRIRDKYRAEFIGTGFIPGFISGFIPDLFPADFG